MKRAGVVVLWLLRLDSLCLQRAAFYFVANGRGKGLLYRLLAGPDGCQRIRKRTQCHRFSRAIVLHVFLFLFF